MLLAFGALMVLLGLLCGGVLTATAAGWLALQPGWTAWLAYPGLTLLGYGLFVIPAHDRPISALTRGVGAACAADPECATGRCATADGGKACGTCP